MSAAHTPTPWHVIVDDSGGQFTGWPSISAAEELDTTVIHRAGFKQEYWGDLSQRDTLANAAFIVRAVNAHADLVAAAKLFERTIQYEIDRSTRDGDDEGARLKTFALATVRAALAKAEAQS